MARIHTDIMIVDSKQLQKLFDTNSVEVDIREDISPRDFEQIMIDNPLDKIICIREYVK